MNLLFVYEVDYLKKVVYDMHMLAEAMSLRNHTVYAIDYESMWNGSRGTPRALRVRRVFHDSKLRLIRPPSIRLPMINRISAFASHHFAIGKIIKEKKIDAIVLYSVPTNGLQTVYWARKYGIPVVFRSLDVLNQIVTNRILYPVIRYLERRVYSKVDVGLTLTPQLSEYMRLLGATKTQVLPMPVDIDSFKPFKPTIGERWGIGDGAKVVLFMGTLFEFSGLASLILKFKYILREIPEARLLIVGDGPQRLLLESIIKIAGVEQEVIITGFQSYDDMPEYINLAKVCVLPFEVNSITRDIFPGKVVQYLACGKPVVASALPGVMSLIDGDTKGVTYAGNLEMVVTKLGILLGNNTLAIQLGQNGLQYATKNHDCKIMAERLEKIIEGVIQKC